MRSNKGITIISLIIYIIVFMIVIATVSTLSGYFVKNADEVVISSKSSQEITRFTTYLSNDINSVNFKSIDVKENYISITFMDDSTHKYVYVKNTIYYIALESGRVEKNITLCEDIKNYSFQYDQDNKKLKISITINGITYNNNYSV